MHALAGLTEYSKISVYKLLGPMINPLFQNGAAIIDAGICTDKQYAGTTIDMLDRMANIWLRTETTKFEER